MAHVGHDPGPPYHRRDNDIAVRDRVNRSFMQQEHQQPQPRTFAAGMDFIRRNADADNWFLHMETFDPHEPYFCPDHYKDLYPEDYDGPHFDWPPYGEVEEPEEMVEHCRRMCAALTSMCDAYMGKILDLMDELEMWDDTMLIVNTDHGFLMGEHGHWSKCCHPFYNEIAHVPLFIWDPQFGVAGERRQSLVQTIDLAPTVLDAFGFGPLPYMQGTSLRDTVADDTPVRKAGLFGIHGGHVNVTDADYVYMRAPAGEDNAPLYNYTLMPTHMTRPFGVEELRTAELAPPFPFTKDIPLVRTDSGGVSPSEFVTMLFDLENDPQQESPIDDPEVEERMIRHMVDLLQWNDAPEEQYERLGLTDYV
jgi:arylsulfatase A-like enzyme